MDLPGMRKRGRLKGRFMGAVKGHACNGATEEGTEGL